MNSGRTVLDFAGIRVGYVTGAGRSSGPTEAPLAAADTR
ncbi:hypothetical protein JOF36_003846 [Pseudonocardia parietis]|uniref:Uncharacterized protein n=1 Tax=Pseudonocardia parietis TaxID=570936 RepID=A0ABS4VW40_9PSEU|nr:hypothetical protein [Pseudonocardia parietis]